MLLREHTFNWFKSIRNSTEQINRFESLILITERATRFAVYKNNIKTFFFVNYIAVMFDDKFLGTSV